MPRPIEDPILAYTAAEGAINQVINPCNVTFLGLALLYIEKILSKTCFKDCA
jgi:hypothetical protein